LRIALTSDLHVDHHPEVVELVAARLAALAPDVAVIAGDVSHDEQVIERALARFAAAAERVAYLPGNHDLWCRPGAPSSRARYLEVLPAACARAGVHALQAGPLEVGGVTLAGETGWFDYSLRNRALDETFPMTAYRSGAWGRLRWSDKLHVRFEGDDGALLDDEALTGWMAARLSQKLARTRGPTVAVTHHLAFAELALVRGEAPWDFLNGFIGAARLGEAIAACPRVRVALAGHTHLRRSALVAGAGGPIRCEVSPVGYPREYRRAGLDLAARVEARVLAIDLDAAGAVLASPAATASLTPHARAG
jgi:hypothetical protein